MEMKDDRKSTKHEKFDAFCLLYHPTSYDDNMPEISKKDGYGFREVQSIFTIIYLHDTKIMGQERI